ncbi:mechanosensitive ion channel family protein [Hymenobacter psychrophilus]|uniref:Small-conductance mechanosensitive channel n=1 Tax=Hymenobacter psychrophilus TaxID=651662 RepID=A0A1H3BWU5_9BACT|nr:mechanosensitive ion channel domain-containing protein [Hymenobacter psychrophilus]SDX46326.1 Small-conductance mechanosensitive channel [Hymenobacter psychrophilus]
MTTDVTHVLIAYWERFLFVLPKLLIALVLLAVGLFVAGRLSTLLSHRLHRRSADPLLADFLTQISKWALALIAFLIALNVLGFTGVVGSLLGAAGVSAFIVGFAFKDIAENFLAGVILAFNRPFHIDDTVQVNDLVGHVVALNLRTTLMRTFDGKHIFVPNSMVLKQPLTNYTRDGDLRSDFLLTVELGADGTPDDASRIIISYLQTVLEVQTDAKSPYVNLEKAAATTVDLRVYFWGDSEDYRRGVLQLKSRLMQEVKQELVGAGFSVPALAG